MIELRFANLSKKHKKFLLLAMQMAENSECSFRHGSVLVRGGRVLSVGFNKPRNSSSNTKHQSIHAEEDVIKRARTSIKGATLYVARINRNGDAMLSMPCIDCMRVLEASEIKAVYYTT